MEVLPALGVAGEVLAVLAELLDSLEGPGLLKNEGLGCLNSARNRVNRVDGRPSSSYRGSGCG